MIYRLQSVNYGYVPKKEMTHPAPFLRALKNSHFLSGSFYICIFRLLFLKSSGVAKKSAVNKSTNSGKRHDLCHNLLFQFHNSFYIYCERCKIHLKGHGKQPS